jgi:KDO2-lipid IV(A) lauroyltransferase
MTKRERGWKSLSLDRKKNRTMLLPLKTPFLTRLYRYVEKGAYLVTYGPFLGLTLLAQRLPVRVAYSIASLVGDLLFLFWHRGRANTIDNMRHVLGREATDREVRQTARRSFRNYMKLLVDFVRLPRTSDKEVESRIRGKGWEHLDLALRGGKGALLVGTHLGSWDLAGLALAARGHELYVVAERQKPLWLDRIARDWREARGIHLIFMEQTLKPLFRALAANQLVGIVVDRPLSEGEGVTVEFFGQMIPWASGPAALALRTGAQIITGYLVRTLDGHFRGEIFPPLEFQPSGDRFEDRRRLSQKIVTLQEELIRHYPDQWYMFRRMWPSSRGG